MKPSQNWKRQNMTQLSVIRESESEIQNETSSPEEKRLFGINIVLTAAIIIVLFGLLWYGRGNEK